MAFYVGMDLHSSNTYLGILDHNLKRVFEKRVMNELPLMLTTLEPFREELQGIAVESTYNWYWLVDGLMDAGYRAIHLANPCAVKQYEGLKYADDRHDAFWLAHLLAFGILPRGYIYPKKDRPVRDLLRKRSFLVKQRTMLILSLKSLVERQTSLRLDRSEMKTLEPSDLELLLPDEHLVLSAQTNLWTISFLTHQITMIEKAVKKKSSSEKPLNP